MEDKKTGKTEVIELMNEGGLESLQTSQIATPVQTVLPTKAPRKHLIWTKIAVIAILVFFASGTSASAWWFFTKSGKAFTTGTDVLQQYPSVTSKTVLGQSTNNPVQSITNVDKVTVNGGLVINGSLALSQAAIDSIQTSLVGKVNLNTSTLGPVQTGNINISGSVLASDFQGNGSGLSNLNATSITTGTLSDDRLSPNVTQLGQTIPLSALQTPVLTSLNGIKPSGSGNVDIVAGVGIDLATDTNNHTITITSNAAASSGDITSVIAGAGLAGGGTSGDVTLSLDLSGSGSITVQGNTFNGAGQLVELDGSSRLPAVNGSLLTNLNASSITTGFLDNSHLNANVTVLGNTTNAPNGFVILNGSGFLPTLNGVNLTNLTAGNISAGGTLPSLNAAALTSLTAGNITANGTLPVLNGSNLTNLTAGNLAAGGTLPSLVGSNLTSLTAGNISAGGTLPSLNGGALTSLNAASISTGLLDNSHLQPDVALLDALSQTFTGNLTVSGTTTLNSPVTVHNTSTTAFNVQNALGTSYLDVDTQNHRVGIGTTSPQYDLDVAGNGNINAANSLLVGGSTVCTINGCTAAGGSSSYIQNGIALQSGANFNIQSTIAGSPVAVLQEASGQSVDALDVKNSGGTVIASISKTGAINIASGQSYTIGGADILARTSGSTQTFSNNNTFTGQVIFHPLVDDTSIVNVVGHATNASVFDVDSVHGRVGVNNANPQTSLDVNGIISASTDIQINGTSVCTVDPGNGTGCAPAQGSNYYIQNGLAQQIGNLYIESVSGIYPVAVLQGSSGQTADLLDAKNVGGTIVADINANGDINTIGQYEVDGLQIASSNLRDTNNIPLLSTTSGTQTFTTANVFGGLTTLNGQVFAASTAGNNNSNYFQIQDSFGHEVLNADTTNDRLGVGTNSPQYKLDVSGGDINTTGQYRIGGVLLKSTDLDDSGSLARIGANNNFSGSNVFGGGTTFQSSTDTNHFVQIQNSLSTPLFDADTSLGHIGIGTATTTHTLEVAGDINASTAIYVGGIAVCTTAACAPSSASANYINNTTSPQTANIAVKSAASGSVTAVLQGAGSQTADILDAENSSGTVLASINKNGTINIASGQHYDINGAPIKSTDLADTSSIVLNNINNTFQSAQTNTFNSTNVFNGSTSLTGAVTVQNSSDNNGNFQVQNAGGSSIFDVDSSQKFIGIDNGAPNYTLDVTGDINASHAIYLNGSLICGATPTTCAPSSASANYINNTTSPQTANIAVKSAASGSVVEVLQGASSQSADILEVKNSGGTVLAQIDSAGNINTTGQYEVGGAQIGTSNLQDGANIAKTDVSHPNTFNNANTFTSGLTTNSITPTSSLTVGATGQSFTLQGSAASTLTATASGHTTTLGFTGTAVGNVVYNFDTSVTAGTYTVCTTFGNCTGTGGGVTTPNGTVGSLARFTGAQVIGNSAISDNGSSITLGETTLVQPASSSTTAFNVQDTSNASIFDVDTTNGRVGIGTSSPGAYNLDVAGTINASTNIYINGQAVCTVTACSGGGGGSGINNGTSLQTNANFNIQSASSGSVVGVLQGASGQSVDLFEAKDNSGSVVASIGSGGTINVASGQHYDINGSPLASTDLSDTAHIVLNNASNTFSSGQTNTFNGSSVYTGTISQKNTSNSTSAFNIQDSSSLNLFNVDTTLDHIGIGTTTTTHTLEVAGDINASTNIYVAGAAVCTASSCAPSSASANYINNTTSPQTANIAVKSAANTSVTAVLQGASSQSADILDAENSSGTVLASIDKNGSISIASGQHFKIGTNALKSTDLADTTNIVLNNINNTFQSGSTTTFNGATGFNDVSTFNSSADFTGDANLTGAVNVQNATDSNGSFQIQDVGGASLFDVDSSQGFIGISNNAPAYTLDVGGDGNLNLASSGTLSIGGTSICTISGCNPNSSGYILNDTAVHTGNINIQTDANGDPALVLQAQSGDESLLFEALDSTGSPLAAISSAGNFIAIGGINAIGGYEVNGNQLASTDLADTGDIPYTYKANVWQGLYEAFGSNTSGGFVIVDTSNSNYLLQADTIHDRIGIGVPNGTNPGNLLSVGVLTTADASGQLAVATGADSNKGIIIQANSATQSADLLQAQSSTGAVLDSIDASGNLTTQNLTVKSITLSGHIVSSGSAPTTGSIGNDGTGATKSLTGTDTAGTITLTTGTGTITDGDIITVTFATAYGSTPNVVFSPANINAAKLSGAAQIFVTPTTTTFKFTTSGTPLQASLPYKWTYHVIQ